MPLPFSASRPFAARCHLAYRVYAAWVNFYCRNSLIPHRFRKFATRMPCPPEEFNLRWFLHLALSHEGPSLISKSKKMVGIHKSEGRAFRAGFRAVRAPVDPVNWRSFVGMRNPSPRREEARPGDLTRPVHAVF